MKANEIRIGNWFKFIGKELPTHILDNKIFQWNTDCWNYENEGGDILKNTKGISLTEDWVKRSKFKIFIDRPEIIIFNRRIARYQILSISHDRIYNTFTVQLLTKINSLAIKIKYVHQLQNFYFVMANREIKL